MHMFELLMRIQNAGIVSSTVAANDMRCLKTVVDAAHAHELLGSHSRMAEAYLVAVGTVHA